MHLARGARKRTYLSARPLRVRGANQLAEAADKLTGAVKSFRLLAEEPPHRQAADLLAVSIDTQMRVRRACGHLPPAAGVARHHVTAQ